MKQVCRFILLVISIIFFNHYDIKSQWVQSGPYGGAVSTMIAINDTLFAASDNGIFKSVNNGDVWKRESEGLPSSFKVSKFLYADSIIYAGTNKGLFTYSLTKSQWTANPIMPLNILDFEIIKKYNNTRIVITDGKTIYASEKNSNYWAYVEHPSPGDSIKALSVFDSKLFSCTPGKIFTIPADFNANTKWQTDTAFATASTTHQFTSGMDTLFLCTTHGLYIRIKNLATWNKITLDLKTSMISLTSKNYVSIIGNTLIFYNFPSIYTYNLADKSFTVNIDMYIIPLQKNTIPTKYFGNGSFNFRYNKLGIFRSKGKSLANYIPINTGLGNAVVQLLKIMDNKIYAGSLEEVLVLSNNSNTWESRGRPGGTIRGFTILRDTVYVASEFFSPYRTAGGSSSFYSDTLSNTFNYFSRRFYSIINRDNTIYVVSSNGIEKSKHPTIFGGEFEGFDEGIKFINNGSNKLSFIAKNNLNFLFFSFSNKIYRNAPDKEVWENKSIFTNGKYSTSPINSLYCLDSFLYATTDTGIFRSGDMGDNWKFLNNNPGSISIKAITNVEKVLYAISNNGKIFRSEDFGDTWENINFDLPKNISLLDIAGDHEFIYLGTNGASVWKFPVGQFKPATIVNKNIENGTASTASISGIISPNGYATTLHIEYSTDSTFKNKTISVKLNDTLRNDNTSISYLFTGLSEKTKYYFRWKATNSANLVTDGPKSSFTTKAFTKIDSIKTSSFIIKTVVADTTGKKVSEKLSSFAGIVLNQNIPNTVVKLNYRNFINPVWKDSIVLSKNDTFLVKLPVRAFDAVGLEYFFTMYPPPGYSSKLKKDTITATTKVAIVYTNGLPLPYPLKTGIYKEDYNLISIPLDLHDSRPESIIYKIIATDKPDDTKFRLLHYVGPLGNPNYKDIYQINPQEIIAGKGYWFAAKKVIAPFSTGKGATVATNTFFDGEYFNVPIKKGFNQIGNPFLLNINWKDVQDANNQIGPLIGFVNTGDTIHFKNLSILEPFKGGFVKSSTSAEILKIPIRKDISNLRLGKDNEYKLLVDFILLNGKRINELSEIGIHPAASNDVDNFDLPIPPMTYNFPSLIFTGKENLLRSFLAPDLEGNFWDFDIKDLNEFSSTLKWNIHEIETGKQLWLLNLFNKDLINMQVEKSYMFQNGTTFKILYGDENYINSSVSQESPSLEIFPIPCKGILNYAIHSNKNYSFNIKIFDAFGREVFVGKTINNNGKLDVSNLPKGMYFLNYDSELYNHLPSKLIKFLII